MTKIVLSLFCFPYLTRLQVTIFLHKQRNSYSLVPKKFIQSRKCFLLLSCFISLKRELLNFRSSFISMMIDMQWCKSVPMTETGPRINKIASIGEKKYFSCIRVECSIKTLALDLLIVLEWYTVLVLTRYCYKKWFLDLWTSGRVKYYKL